MLLIVAAKNKKRQKKMKREQKITKDALISMVNNLNEIIKSINYDNCYDLVVKFFGITSLLDDNWDDVTQLPLKGWKILGIKSKSRKDAEAEYSFFFEEIHKAGRNPYGINRTAPGEPVTKETLYFGDVWGIWTDTVAKFEKTEDDEFVQEKIRQQIYQFVKSYDKSFKLDWLR